MQRRDFHKGVLAMGLGAHAGLARAGTQKQNKPAMNPYQEPARQLPCLLYTSPSPRD